MTEIDLLETLRATTQPDKAVSAFVREAKNEEFPLNSNHRLSQDSLWRLRSIDGRLLADLEVDGTQGTEHLTVWFERQKGQWLISGWLPLSKTKRDTGVLSTLKDLPIAFAAPALRGGPPPLIVRIASVDTSSPDPIKTTQTSTAHLRLKVNINRACKGTRSIRHLKSLKKQLNGCYDMMPKAKQLDMAE